MRKHIAPLAMIATALLIAPLAHARTSPLPDFDGNGIVDFPDFLQFVSKFGSQQGDGKYEAQYDLDGDGTIGFPDFLIFVRSYGDRNPFEFPLRSLHNGGNWGTNPQVVEMWEAAGRVGPLVPPDYIEWLKSLHVNWIGIDVSLPHTDSMDSTVERVYAHDVDIATYSGELTYSDDALRQMIREFRAHGFDVYLTLALQVHEENSPRPVERWLIGHPYGHELASRILPENWPWRLDHPDHQRFIAEFWETYTQQAVHFAQIAEAEGVRLYSLGTETESLFRTRPAEDPNDPEVSHWTNDFGPELKAMVARVRGVYSGLLTYDMHSSALTDPEYFGPGSNHLWEDLDLEIVGVSAYFPLSDSPPSTVLSVASLEASYDRIFQDYLIPLANRNPTRPILFLEYAAQDDISAPALLGHSHFSHYVFTDADGNGLDDGEETQANIYQALLNAIDKYPGVVNGVFYYDHWLTSEELWNETWARNRSLSIKGKLAEDVVRAAYRSYKQANP